MRSQQLTLHQTNRGIRLLNLNAAIVAVFNNIVAGPIVVGLALYLGASNFLVGLLSSAGGIGQVIQMLSPLVGERQSRYKPLLLWARGAGYLIWLLIAVVPFTLPRPHGAQLLIVMAFVASLCFAIAVPGGTAWVSDLVPPRIRGRFMARQNLLMGITGLTAMIGAGRFVDMVPKTFGFRTVFTLAALCGFASLIVLSVTPEPRKTVSERLALLKFMTLAFRRRNYRNFLVFSALRTLCIMIAAPFFSVFMLSELKIDYSWVTAFTAVSTVTQMMTYQLWGYLTDRYGNKPALVICSSAISAIPFLWCFVTRHNYLVLIPLFFAYGGFVASGQIIAQFNLMLKIAPERNRTIYFGTYSAAVGLGAAIGSILGGFIGDHASHVHATFLFFELSPVKVVFLVSWLARISVLPMLGTFRELHEQPAKRLLGDMRTRNPFSLLVNLLRFRSSPGVRQRAEATRALGTVHSGLVVEELIKALDDASRHVRRDAARALGETRDPRAVRELVAKLSDTDADIIEEAAEALGHIGDPMATSALAELLNGPDTMLRRTAAVALGDIGGDPARRLLRERLGTEQEAVVHVALADALSRIGDHSVMHELRTLLRHFGPGIARRQIANSIGSLLGQEGEFYRLLQADEFHQTDMVMRLLSGAKRRMLSRQGVSPTDRDFIGIHIDAAVQRYEDGRYAEAVVCLKKVASRALRRFAVSTAGLGIRDKVEAPQPPFPSRDSHREMSLGVREILARNATLRANFGFLSATETEAHERRINHEEALLCAFAFEKVTAELARLRRKTSARES